MILRDTGTIVHRTSALTYLKLDNLSRLLQGKEMVVDGYVPGELETDTFDFVLDFNEASNLCTLVQFWQIEKTPQLISLPIRSGFSRIEIQSLQGSSETRVLAAFTVDLVLDALWTHIEDYIEKHKKNNDAIYFCVPSRKDGEESLWLHRREKDIMMYKVVRPGIEVTTTQDRAVAIADFRILIRERGKWDYGA